MDGEDHKPETVQLQQQQQQQQPLAGGRRDDETAECDKPRQQQQQEQQQPRPRKRNRCPNDSCNRPIELFAKDCIGCGIRHCFACRLPEVHSCANMEAVRQRDLDRLKSTMPSEPIVAAKV